MNRKYENKQRQLDGAMVQQEEPDRLVTAGVTRGAHRMRLTIRAVRCFRGGYRAVSCLYPCARFPLCTSGCTCSKKTTFFYARAGPHATAACAAQFTDRSKHAALLCVVRCRQGQRATQPLRNASVHGHGHRRARASVM